MNINKESNEEAKTYIFSHKVHRILSYFSLICIPCFIVLLLYNFNVFGMVGFIFLSLFIIFCCYWCNVHKLVLYDDKIVLQSIRKRIFMLSKIQSISLNEQYLLKIVYNDKVFLSTGFLPLIWCGSANYEKNSELLKTLEKAIKKAKTGVVNRKAIKNIEVVAEKRMWTIFVMLFYLLIDIFLIFSLIKEWNIVVFWIALIWGVINILLLMYKLFSPKYIVLYDPTTKAITINKIFRSMTVHISDIEYVYYVGRLNNLSIRLKNKKTIIIGGMKKIFKVSETLNNIISK